jgi:DNA topoisomerase I
VDSGQVNDYLREAAGADFTAKDFRTWGATLRAVELLAVMPFAVATSERDA